MENISPTPPMLSQPSSFFDRILNSILLKMFVIFILILILLLPMSWVDSLIEERKNREQDVTTEISSKWGREQVVSGPILAVPYDYVRETIEQQDEKGKERTVKYTVTEWAFLLPKHVDIQTSVQPEKRSRGIYTAILYNSSIEINGKFGGFDFNNLAVSRDKLKWGEAKLIFGVQDFKGLLAMPKLKWGSADVEMTTNDQSLQLFARNIVSKVPMESNEDATIAFKIALNLRGSKSLNYLPMADQTYIHVEGKWDDPSFNGGYLPEDRKLDQDAFTAKWSIPSFNRKVSDQWTGLPSLMYSFQGLNLNEIQYSEAYDQRETAVAAVSAGDATVARATDQDMVQINFLPEVNNYQKTMRVAKYAMLIIVLTFVSLFFTEIIKKQRIHLIQYVLIGVAMILFYSLLLAISEHQGFNVAYLVAALATVGLISSFIHMITKDKRTAFLFGGILSLFYTFIFVLMQLRDFSLIVGTIGVFVILAVLMRVSTKINWYQFDKK